MEKENKKTFNEKLLSLQEKVKNNLKKEKIKDKNKISFYKKVWFSITKVQKYPEMAKEKAKGANKYLMIIVAVFTLMLSIASAYEMDKEAREGIKYIKENLPEFVYKDGNISSNTTEKVILDNKYIKAIFDGKIIMDTNIENEDIVNQYIQEIGTENKSLILLKDKLITVNWGNIKTQEYTYKDLLKQYAEKNGAMQEITEINKENVVSYFQTNTNSFPYYLVQYFVIYFITYFVTFMIYGIFLCIVGYLTSKILKVKLKLLEVYTMAIYAFTFPIILFYILSFTYYYIEFNIPYLIEIFIAIAYIYLIAALLNIKNNNEKEVEN